MTGKIIPSTRRINPYPTDLNKLEELNALSRYICENKPPCDEVERRICAIMAPAEKRIYKSKGDRVCAAGVRLYAVFGGSLRDGLAAGVVAVLMYLWDYFFSARQKPGRVQPCDLHCGGAFVYFVCFCGNWTAYRYGDDWQHYAADSRISLMNALRDMMCGDIITGILRLAGGADDGSRHRGGVWYCHYDAGRAVVK